VEVPENLKRPDVIEESIVSEEFIQEEKVKNRKSIKDFWGKFKDGIIELFKEEEDHAL
jgi:cell division protein FtsA